LDIKNFSFQQEIWWDLNDTWETVMTINDMHNVFILKIINQKEKWEVLYENTKHSKEDVDEILKQIESNKEVRAEIEEIKTLTSEIDEIITIGNIDSLEIILKDYELKDDWEHMTFQIKGFETEFHWSIRKQEIDFYSNAYLPDVKRKNYIGDVEHYFPSLLTRKIINEIRNHPKAKLRRLFKR